MIDLAMSLLQAELASYLTVHGDDAANVRIDNIGLAETSSGNSLIDHIVITLVNIEEESALKNQSALRRSGNAALYETAPTFLNLYVLISCNYFGDGYTLALRRLSLVIQFLQGKTSFSGATSASGNPDLADLRFTLELYTLTFEQINHLWGSLGGRQVPFAMYKLRLVAITDRKRLREVPLIEEIDTTVSKISNNI
jgi:Pvc16 N-terminal domain